MYKKSCTKLLFCFSTYCFFRRSRCRQKRRKRLPTLKAMQERNLCLQGRMGRFSEWSSVSFNVTITNFFGTIERFGITLISLQQTSHSDWQLLKLGQKGKKQFNWSSLENHFFVDRERSSFFPQSHSRRAKKLNRPRSSLASHVCSVLSVHCDSKKKQKTKNKKTIRDCWQSNFCVDIMKSIKGGN